MTKPLSIAEARTAGILPSPTGKQAPIPGPPRPESTSARVSTKPAPEVSAEKLKPMLVHVSTYEFNDGTNRVVFPKVPKEQTEAFITHCQQFNPLQHGI